MGQDLHQCNYCAGKCYSSWIWWQREREGAAVQLQQLCTFGKAILWAKCQHVNNTQWEELCWHLSLTNHWVLRGYDLSVHTAAKVTPWLMCVYSKMYSNYTKYIHVFSYKLYFYIYENLCLHTRLKVGMVKHQSKDKFKFWHSDETTFQAVF